MAKRFVNIDRSTPILLPQDMRDWLPQDHIARFIIEAVDSSDLSLASVNKNGSGDCQYPPGMMLSMLIYAYCTGRFSSRSIEEATFSDVALRFITADTHPDHDTVCTFRRNNGSLISSVFLSVLVLAKELKFLSVGTVSIDGSKIEANASKHKAVSFGRAQEKIDHLQSEVTELLERAEKADSTPLADGLSVPKEIQRREDRIAQLLKAREAIKARVSAITQNQPVIIEIKDLKTSHFLERKRALFGREGATRMGHDQCPQSEPSNHHLQFNGSGLVPAADCPRTWDRSGDRGQVSATPGKTRHFDSRL
jgi:transposase